MDNFDLKKFLTENQLTTNTRRRPIMIDDMEVDRGTIEVDGIDPSDYPDFADAYVMAADFVDGTPLTDDQLQKLTDRYVYDFVVDKIYEENKLTVNSSTNEQEQTPIPDFEKYLRGDVIDLRDRNGWNPATEELYSLLLRFKTTPTQKKALNRSGTYNEYTFPVKIDNIEYTVKFAVDSSD